MNTALWKIGIGMVILLAVGFLGVGRLRFEGETEPPAPIYTEMLRLPPSRQEMSDFSRHKQLFDRIWFARYQRNVVDDLVKFLDDPSRSLRVRAVRSLAHLEDPAAEAPLSAKLENSQAGSIVNDKDLLLPTLLKISLARIQTRNMIGRARVDVVAKSVGLSFDEVIQLFGNTDGVIRAEEASNRDQIILAEVVDLLCVMSGKGENIQALIMGKAGPRLADRSRQRRGVLAEASASQAIPMGEKMGDNVFGKRLRPLRRERKLAQRYLAAQTGVAHTHLCLPWGRRDLLV